MKIRIAETKDLKDLLDIYNYEVLHGVATFDTQPWTLEERLVWFEEHKGHHPLLVAETDGRAVAYASLSGYRTKDAYRGTVEVSLYVNHEYRGQGIGRSMLQAILDAARADETIHTVISVITGGNGASIRLHEEFGFTDCGTLREVGKKFDRWLDIVNLQLMV